MILPHEGVYTRLQRSSLHGIGVFAILKISAGTYIFEPDDAALISVDEKEIEQLAASLQTLYRDFCPKVDGVYQCPSSFNALTPSWFLNHSDNPNVGADSELKFYALRDIDVGDELTSDYETYSECNDLPNV